MATLSFVRTLTKGVALEAFVVSSPALVLLALARAGVLAAQASFAGSVVVVLFGPGVGGAIVEALASLSIYTPPHALGLLPSSACAAAFAAAVEGIAIGALLESGWTPAGSLSFSSFVRMGSRRESHSLWLRPDALQTVTDALTVRVVVEVGGNSDGWVARATVTTKGGALRVTRPIEGTRGTRVFVLPSLAPCWLASEAISPDEQGFSLCGALLNITTAGGFLTVNPSSRALHSMLGITTETGPYGDHEDRDSEMYCPTGPTCIVPRDACITDAIGLRTSTRERGVIIEKDVYALFVALGATIVKTTAAADDGVDIGAGGAGAGAAAAAGKSSVARPTSVPFVKASSLHVPGSLKSPSPIKTGLAGFLSDGIARKERTDELTIRSAGDMLRGSGGSVLDADGLHVAPAPPSRNSACFICRERPDCTLSLGIADAPRSEVRHFSLASLVCADTSAPLALSDILGEDGRTMFDIECHYKRRDNFAQPLPAVLGLPAARALEPAFSASFQLAPHALSIRLGTKSERVAEKARTLALSGPDEYEDDGRLRVAGPHGAAAAAAPAAPDVCGTAIVEPDTAAPAVKRAKLVKVAVSASETAAEAIDNELLVNVIASVASDETALMAAGNKALQAFLRSEGLPVSGTKTQLVQRILARAAKTVTMAVVTTPAAVFRTLPAEKKAAPPTFYGILDDGDEL